MTLNSKEKAIVSIASSLAVYSMRQEEGVLPKNQSMIDFILKTAPEGIKSEISMNLIDEIFDFISEVNVERS